MESTNITDRLIVTFKEETSKLKEKFEDCQYNIKIYFKNNNPQKGVHSVDAIYEFDKYILQIQYKVNVSMFIPKSLLEMRFMLKTGNLPVEYSIYDMLDVMKVDDFKCYTIPYISNEKVMISSIKYLANTFKKYKKRIEKIASDDEKIHELEKNVDDKIYLLLNERVFKSRSVTYLTNILELYYVVDTSRFTGDIYSNVIKANYDKALKKYAKLKGKLTYYEQRLIKYITKNEIKDILPVNLLKLKESKKVLSSIKSSLVMLLTCLLLTPAWCVVYFLVFLIAYLFFNNGAIYTSYTNYMVIPAVAFITSIISSYFLRKKAYKIFFKKEQKEILAIDELENSPTVERRMSKFLQFVIAVSLVFTILLANTNIQFRNDNIICNLNLLSIKGQTINYENIEKMYKAKSVTNDFGKRINETAYVILLKNNEQIDLYYDISDEDVEKYILPIIIKKNIPIEEIDTVK